MTFTILNSLALIVLGLTGFIQWDHFATSGIPTEMLMPVFFGGAQLICLGFSKEHYRHGLYGGLIFAMLGVISAGLRINQYGITTIAEPKTLIIVTMAAICSIQFFVSWKEVQADRAIAPPQ